MGDVAARDGQVVALAIFAAQYDMGVGLGCVEMINGHPIELRFEVALHSPHKIAHEWFEILHLGRVFRRNDEAELVAICVGVSKESIAIDVIVARIV